MRAENRHHRRRKIAATKRWVEQDQGKLNFPLYLWGKRITTPEELSKEICKKAITPQSCSCGDHGWRMNPRKRGEGDPLRDRRQVNYDEDQARLYHND
jgi:hypothetical protein